MCMCVCVSVCVCVCVCVCVRVFEAGARPHPLVVSKINAQEKEACVPLLMACKP